ncbi:periplasmic binding protein [Gloeocapsa sp. PCC 7428]|uniref:ABC transporter substrate-binding protein n=1 Tax=Gloeocapsa sp. PCC 7428 TaxID=1173026 RepID=UPI0002A61AE6|nr:iron-siderophore ABC transporter substrate-binding protein [Gloeocapsa sp. PCC 7428]AFZ33000.1 periplasmic binding protein [Gloeocapsa sp. PCC 7428]
MKIQMYRLIKLFLLVIFSFLSFTACHQSGSQNVGVSSTPSECRVVQHKLGEACIPINPKRIVLLEDRFMPDALLSLGIKPIGITFSSYEGKQMHFGLSNEEIAEIEIVGDRDQPSLEKILTLKPDLILSSFEYVKQTYSQLSGIAPTVIVEIDELRISIKDNFRAIAKVLEKEKKAEEVLAQYQKRVEELRERIGDQLQDIEVSFIVHYASYGALYEKPASSAPFFQVLNDVGINIKPIFLKENKWTNFSVEVINKYDADILFILNPDNKPLSYFLQNPFISSLKAAKAQRLYAVDPTIWMPYGPLGMNKLLDELPQYLLEGT